MGHRQRQADLVGGAGSVSVGTAGEEGAHGLGPEGESSGAESVHDCRRRDLVTEGRVSRRGVARGLSGVWMCDEVVRGPEIEPPRRRIGNRGKASHPFMMLRQSPLPLTLQRHKKLAAFCF